MKTAFLFSGQGAQYTGMGQELYQSEPIMKETMDQASEILGYDLADVCFNPEKSEKLNQTEYTQPAILTVSVGMWRLLTQQNITCDGLAGLSLGEYSALVASGALSFEDAVALVAKRGALMSQAAPAGTGKMVAVLNADVETIEKCCQEASQFGIVAPANYNTPQQIVIGGEVAAVDKAQELLKAHGVKRMIPLNVSGPFHTPLLKTAADELAKVLTTVKFQPIQVPVISNTTAKVMADDEITTLLPQQVMSPVRFYESIATLQQMGITHFVEIGPGKTLAGFLKKIDKSLQTSSVENSETLAATVASLQKTEA